MTVNIKVGAQLDTADLARRLDEIIRRINATGQSIARAGGVKFEPVSRATEDQLRRVEQTMRNIQKLAPEVAKRLQASGQSSSSLFDVDWAKAYSDPHARNRAARGTFSMATGIDFLDPPAPSSPGRRGGGDGGGGAPPQPWSPAPQPSRIPGVLASVAQRGLSAAGPVGGVAAGGLRAGLAGGAAAGAAGLAGGLAALGVGALISGVRQYVGAAQQEGTGYDTLRNQLGGTGGGIGFNDLRRRLRGASDDTATTYEEAQQLAGLFARRGNSNRAAALADDVTQSAGFARSFGFEPSSGVAAFGAMRGVGVTGNADDSRRLGAQIAEGISRAGVFAKAEEYLSEIANFAETQTRTSLARANVAEYVGSLTGLLSQRLPGLDVHGAAALLGRANSAVQGGGAAGEAGQAFLYQSVGRRLGLGSLDTQIMQEGGIFATGRDTFGPGSSMGGYYRRHGVPVPNSAASSDTTMFEMIQSGLRSRYSDPRLRLNATGNFFGVNMRQAQALEQLDPQQMRGIGRLLSDEQIRGMSATGIQTTARIATGSRRDLDNIADEFASRRGGDALTPGEQRHLTSARNGASEEDYRKLLAEISAGRQQEETEGSRTRRTIQDLEKTLIDQATRLVDPLNTARDALLMIAGRGTGRALTARAARIGVRDAAIAEENDSQARALTGVDPERQSAADAYARAQGLANNNPGDPTAARAAEEARERLEAVERDRERIIHEHEERRRAARQAAEAPASLGEGRPATVGGRATLGVNSRVQEMVEALRTEFPAIRATSGHRPNSGTSQHAHGNAMDLNLEGLTAEERAAVYRRVTSGEGPFRNLGGMGTYDPTGRSLHIDARGGPRMAWGPDRSQRSLGQTPPAFQDAVGAWRRGERPNTLSTPLPAGAPPTAVQDAGNPGGASGPQRILGSVEGTFRLEDARGNEAAPPVTVVTGWRAPRAQGAHQ